MVKIQKKYILTFDIHSALKILHKDIDFSYTRQFQIYEIHDSLGTKRLQNKTGNAVTYEYPYYNKSP